MSEHDNLITEFEEALKATKDGKFHLRLFVSGSTDRSTKAIANVRGICEEHLPGRYQLEVVDLYQQPHLAREDNVVAAPTLLREQPTPVRRIVGDLSDEGRVLVSLEIARYT